MAVKRRLYWVTPEVLHEHELKAQRLVARGFDVRFFGTPEELQSSIRHERAGIVIVSDAGDAAVALERLNKVTDIPETRGVRLFLSIERHHEDVIERAAAANFRDLLPMAIENQQWMKRLEYASAGKPIIIDAPSGQVTMSNISAVHLPARLVWISNDRMRIETSMTPKIGSILNVTGHIATQLGLRSLTFCVEKAERSHLRYRFSDALVGQWTVPREVREQSKRFIETLRSRSDTRTCRVLLAARSSSLRAKIFAELKQPHYEINAILKVQSLVQEPQYFSPDVVIIEDALCLGKMTETFSSMLSQLPLGTPVIISGDSAAAADLVRRNAVHNLILEKRLPPNLLSSQLAKYLQPRPGIHTDADGIPIASRDDYSFIEVATPARLTCLHPTMVQVDLPHRLRPFALCRLSSPILGKVLGRDVWIKLTESYHNDQASDEKFSSTAEAILSDLTRVDRQRMARQVLRLISEHYKKLLQKDDAAETYEEPADRTPELGSLNTVAQAITTSQAVAVPRVAASPRLSPVTTRVATAVPTAPLRKLRPAAASYSWFANKSATTILTQILWSVTGVLVIWAVIWAMSQRDEQDTKESGKWFQDQFYKFAPHKFENDSNSVE